MAEKQKMKFWSIVLLTINSIIGTGIFLSPGSVAKLSGSLAPWIYLCAAVFASVLAITFASAAKYVTKMERHTPIRKRHLEKMLGYM